MIGLGGALDPYKERVGLGAGNEGADPIEEWTYFTPGKGYSAFWEDSDRATITQGSQGLSKCIESFSRAIDRDQLQSLPDGFHPVPHEVITHHPANHEGALR